MSLYISAAILMVSGVLAAAPFAEATGYYHDDDCEEKNVKAYVDQDEAKIIVPWGACPVKITFASYEHDGNRYPLEDQTLIDYITDTYEPGVYYVGPLQLACNWQTDVYYGDVVAPIPHTGLSGMGVLIDSDYVENQNCEEDELSCDIWANKSVVTEGDTVTISWDSEGSGQWISNIGSVNDAGSKTIAVWQDTTFTLHVYGDHGQETQCQVKVEVEEEEEEPSCWIYANPTHIEEGESVYLSWGSEHADSASLTNVGSVSTSGNRYEYPHTDRTYTLTVWGDGGSTQCTTSVYVEEDTDEGPSCEIYHAQQNNYWWNKSSEVYLSWNSDNATYASLSGYGSVAVDGSKTVYPSYTTTYTLTVWDNDGDSDQCSTTVYVNEVEYQKPSCTITLSNQQNGWATLSWGSSHANSASISPDIGSVQLNGYKSVYVDGYSKQYTMTVWGDGGSATCYTSYTPTVIPPYVNLTQIPYTGFDFGPVGNAMYWLGLALLAAGGAYLFVFYRGMVFAGVPQSGFSRGRVTSALRMQYRAFENVCQRAAKPILEMLYLA